LRSLANSRPSLPYPTLAGATHCPDCNALPHDPVSTPPTGGNWTRLRPFCPGAAEPDPNCCERQPYWDLVPAPDERIVLPPRLRRADKPQRRETARPSRCSGRAKE